MTLLSITLSCVLGWCARIVYCHWRQRRRERETSIALVAFAEAEKRVESGVREMQR